jgi:hypothetical protein
LPSGERIHPLAAGTGDIEIARTVDFHSTDGVFSGGRLHIEKHLRTGLLQTIGLVQLPARARAETLQAIEILFCRPDRLQRSCRFRWSALGVLHRMRSSK